ncbi:hypothetical protein GCM10025760_11830 [Microbacterium yannicii]|uniref:Uncharacterized protein n=1 Tax=Microbacterium yannicii TaxID=671622 RepID=A0ABP9M4Q8_9MICO
MTFVMSRIVIAATETHTQKARQRAAEESGMTAVVGGTARAVPVVFAEGDSGISFRLAPLPGSTGRSRAIGVPGMSAAAVCRGLARHPVSRRPRRGIRCLDSFAGDALRSPYGDMLARKRDMMGR